MKHKYTWNHILLFAKVCGQVDDGDSVTASWVRVTEDHNMQTFPFTLWPLTYRTCEVTTSPAMCSPIHLSSEELGCNYDVKIYKCNEVMIVCFQDKPSDSVCQHPCIVDLDDATADETHVDHHSCSKTEPLLPCHVVHCYHQMETRIKDAFYQLEKNIESVVCIGHGASATMAVCLASDMSRTYETEKDFLGLDARRVVVDVVGFSDSVVASPAYWDRFCSFIDEYISLGFANSAKSASYPGVVKMVVNPRSNHVTVDRSQGPVRAPSVFRRLKTKTKSSKSSAAPSEHISDYIQALDKKIAV
ncbi:unnamed protein product, partial [Pylaiella littoralis]